LAAMDEISSILNGGSITFGASGGTLDLASRLAVGASFSAAVNSAALTPGLVRYGMIANTSGSTLGWDSAGRDLNIANNALSSSGALQFELSNGAMVQYGEGSFTGSMNFTGMAAGNAAGGSASTSVGRLLLDGQNSFTFSGGLSFDNAMQVSTTGARKIDANISVNSGEVAFQGQSGAANDLTLGNTIGGKTITIKDGAAATLDLRFRDEASLNTVGGITLNANTVIQAGGSLNFRKSATVVGELLGTITVNGDITGQGTSLNESTISLAVGSGVGGATFTSGSGAAGSDLIVNGSGTGGLRIEGSMANLNNFLTAQRFQDLTGTGGALTIAYNNTGTNSFLTAPTTSTSVRLGFDALNGSNPLYKIGAAVNDLNRWGGLVVKGGRVQTMFNESFTGNAALTSLDLLGGNLILNSGTLARTLTFEGGANLTGGTLDGGAIAGGLVISGDLTHSSATLVNSPNITMNIATSANISGTDISGFGTLAKMGAGTVNVQTGVNGTLIDIQAGTLLMGANNLIGNTTAIRLGGGTLAFNGHSDTAGALTLASNSTIDFNNGSVVWNFANSSLASWSGGTTLSIANWNGSGSGGGSDQLVFGSAMNGLTPAQIAQIRFINPNGINGTFTAQILSSGEIVPVPEPRTIGFGALLVGSLGFRERSRLLKLARFLRSLVAA
jgi:autotransporter family porin